MTSPEAAAARKTVDFERHKKNFTDRLTKIEAAVNSADLNQVANEINEASMRLGNMFLAAEGTTSSSDDVEAVSLQDKLLDKLEAFPTVGPQLREFASALVVYHRAFAMGEIEMGPESPAQTMVLTDAISALQTSSSSIAGSHPRGFRIADIASQRKTDSTTSGYTDTATDFNDTALRTEREGTPPPTQYENNYGSFKTLADYLHLVDFSALVSPVGAKDPLFSAEDQVGVGEAVETITDLGASLPNPLLTKIQTMLDEVEQNHYPTYSSPTSKARFPDLYKSLYHLRQLLYRLLHEHSVLSAGGRDASNRVVAEKRQYFHPSSKQVQESVYGELQMFHGEVRQEVMHSDEIGLRLSVGGALDQNDLDNLEKYKARMVAIQKRYATINATAGDVDDYLDDNTYDRLESIQKEISKYVAWMDFLIAEAQERLGVKPASTTAGTTGPGAGAPAKPPETDTSGFERYWDVLGYDLPTAIERLVTGDFSGGNHDAKQVENAYMAYAEEMGGLGGPFEDLSKMFGILNILYVDGWMNKATALNLDEISLRWDSAKEKFGSGNAVERYDTLRQTDFFNRIIRRLSDRSYVVMCYNHGQYGKWAAGAPWSGRDHIRALYRQCHEDLMREVPDYKAAIEEFPEDAGDSRFSRDMIVKFALDVAWYDATLNDYRTKAEMIHLGILRSSQKHEGGQPMDIVASMLNGGYQIKNYDKGDWATMWGGIIAIPDTIYHGKIPLATLAPSPDVLFPSEVGVVISMTRDYRTGAEKPEKVMILQKMQERVGTYQTMVESFFGYTFRSKDDILSFSRYQPDTVFLIPPVDSFLRAPLIADPSDPTGRLKRDPANNTVNYLKAREAGNWLLDHARRLYADGVELTGDPGTDKQKIQKLIKDWGTRLAMFYGWDWALDAQNRAQISGGMPEAEVVARMHQNQMNFMTTLSRYYVMSILASIHFDYDATEGNSFVGWYADYEEEYDMAVETIVEYAEVNKSFDPPWDELRQAIIAAAHDESYKKRVHRQPEKRKSRYWHAYYSHEEGKSWIQRQVLGNDRLGRQPSYPYPNKSPKETS